jgi:mediator of RNA polymerase II transcription subunit 14
MDHHPTNGHGPLNGVYDPTQADLDRELPLVFDGQVPLGDLLSRVVQSIYAELSELAETCALFSYILSLCSITCVFRMPNMSDASRKRQLADWVVKTKKQVVKLYAVAKWARDADSVQKCMVSNIIPSPSF